MQAMQNYLLVAVLNYNTTYPTSNQCEPGRVFHGRVPYKKLDHQLRLKHKTGLIPTTVFSEELPRKTQFLYDKVKNNVM